MPISRVSLHSWLQFRIRVICGAVLLVSVFVPPYAAEITSAAQDIGQPSEFLLAEDGFLMKTSSLTEQGTRSAYSQRIIHTVEQKESVVSIAKLYDLQPDTIRYANNLDDKATLKPGQTLFILPVDGIMHTVKRGQNLTMIAELYDVPVEKISVQNKIRNGYLLAGQELIIPDGKPIVVPTPAQPTPTISKKPVQVAQTPGITPAATYEITPTAGILQWPCECFLTQNYGARHYGLDLQIRGGGPIFAAEAGEVIRADYGWNGGYGNVIEIDHGDGTITLYAHNKALRVKEGDKVTRGQFIADMGNTGLVHGPTGIHVHFEVQVNGVKRNPKLYLK